MPQLCWSARPSNIQDSTRLLDQLLKIHAVMLLEQLDDLSADLALLGNSLLAQLRDPRVRLGTLSGDQLAKIAGLGYR